MGMDGGTHADAPMPAPRRWGGLRMHHLLVLAFTLVTAIPLAVLAIWEGKTAFQNEMESVRERHLLVARNLTSTMSRYVTDIKAVFSLAAATENLDAPPVGLDDLLVKDVLEGLAHEQVAGFALGRVARIHASGISPSNVGQKHQSGSKKFHGRKVSVEREGVKKFGAPRSDVGAPAGNGEGG